MSRRRAENGTLEDVLHKEAVHPGDVFFIKAGTIHAIGAGITLCEIQQNSNTTYRLYDYHRRDKEGHLRELHLDKALRVSCLQKMETGPSRLQPETIPGGCRTLLGQCRYFVSERYDCDTACDIPLGEDSFRSLVVTDSQRSKNGSPSGRQLLCAGAERMLPDGRYIFGVCNPGIKERK